MQEEPLPKLPNHLSTQKVAYAEQQQQKPLRNGSTPAHKLQKQNNHSKNGYNQNTKLKKKIQAVTKYARNRDHYLYTLFFCLIILNAYYASADPTGFLIDLNFYTYIVLMIIRIFRFSKHKLAFYLADFCYIGNTLVWFALYFFRYNAIAFNMAYFFGVGCLGWSIVAWNNGYILHSIDQMTTVFIHHTCFIVLTAMRWSNDAKLQAVINAPGGSLLDNIGYPIAYYMGWVFCYYVFIFLISWKSIEKNDYDCLYKYTVKVSPLSRKLIFLCGDGIMKKPLFMLTHMLWVYGSGLLAIFCYDCMHLNYLCMILTVIYGAHVGGSYIFKYMVRFYEKGFENQDLKKQGGEQRITSWDLGEVVESLGSGKGFLVPLKKMKDGDKFL